MKKALKITGITLGSLVVLALVLAGAAAWMLTSSGQLTKMVNKYAPQYVNCDLTLGEAKLTLFKTFPNIGVDIKDVALINPMTGSPSDTLAYIDNLVLVMDADRLRKEKEIVVRKCILEDAFVNLYTDSLGNTNFDVFNFNEDDTTSSFDYRVDIETIILKNATVLYSDDRNGLGTKISGVGLELKGKMKDKHIEADLRLASEALSLRMQSLQMALKDWNLSFEGEVMDLNHISGLLQIATPDISINHGQSYLEHDTLDLHLPLQVNLKALKAHLEPSRICLNRSEINLSGDAELAANKDVVLNMNLSASDLVVEDVLTRLPEEMQRHFSGIDCSGRMNITESTVKGVYNDSLMPVITAKITTDKANVNVTSLPHSFTEVDLDASLYLDLNTKVSSVNVSSLKTRFNRSSLAVNGIVEELLGDMRLKLKVKGDIPLTDLKCLLPENIKFEGRSALTLSTDFTLSQLQESLKDYDFNRLKANGTVSFRNFAVETDSIRMAAPNLKLTLASLAQGIYATLNAERFVIGAGESMGVEAEYPDIKLTLDRFGDGFEKMDLDADLRFRQLDVTCDSIVAHLEQPVVKVVTLPEKSDQGLNADVSLDGMAMVVAVGETYRLNTNLLRVDASVSQDKTETGFLKRWNPLTELKLDHALLSVEGLDEDVHVSNVDFFFNTHQLDFRKSTFIIGKSDLGLQGSLSGVIEWMEDHKNLMKGDFQLTSEMLDINEIMDLTSGWGASDKTVKAKEGNKEDNPFMVPEGVDFSFGIKTKKALYDNFDLNDLGGRMTVKDGTLILQEIGFTNKAAEMKLTAMYQSPRRNNLFLAMDFHLLNVQINDLLHMIPYIDTLVPMLKTFDGEAEFHIGAETNLKANYEPKVSTLRAAADIEGKNLSVNDHFTFTRITDKLDISTNGEYRVDSLDVQLTAFKDEIYLLPSQVAIGKYKVIVAGRMTLDKNGEYHLSVTESPLPTRFGLSISGPLHNLEYKLEKSQFPTLYKPNKRSDTEQMYIELKKRIADQMKENVK